MLNNFLDIFFFIGVFWLRIFQIMRKIWLHSTYVERRNAMNLVHHSKQIQCKQANRSTCIILQNFPDSKHIVKTFFFYLIALQFMSYMWAIRLGINYGWDGVRYHKAIAELDNLLLSSSATVIYCLHFCSAVQ